MWGYVPPPKPDPPIVKHAQSGNLKGMLVIRWNLLSIMVPSNTSSFPPKGVTELIPTTQDSLKHVGNGLKSRRKWVDIPRNGLGTKILL